MYRARFTRVAIGATERDSFYHLTLQLPPQDETDWTTITLSGVTSLQLERMVERLSSSTEDDIHEVVTLVEDLHDNPPTSSSGESESTGQGSVEQSPEQVMDITTEEVSSTTEPPPPALTSGTVAETVYPPVLLARRANAMPGPRKSMPALLCVRNITLYCEFKSQKARMVSAPTGPFPNLYLDLSHHLHCLLCVICVLCILAQ